MTLTAIQSADLLIQLHLAFGALSVALGPVALYRRRRDWAHRLAGRVWVAAMAGLAVSGLFIHTLPMLGPFSVIHLLSVLALGSLWRGVRFIRLGQVAAHRAVMRALYWQALGIGGLFTFLPGRTLNETLFPGAPTWGWAVIIAGLSALAWARWAGPFGRTPQPR